MHASPLCDLIEVFERHGWTVRVEPPAGPVGGRVLGFPGILAFANRVRACVAPDGQAWFLGSEEYLDHGGEGWNFLETQVSLASAAGDAAWTAEVRSFWNENLPFALSTRGEYAYLAIDRSGRVWAGVAPELEGPGLVADSLEEFAGLFERQARDRQGALYDDWLRDP